MVHQRWWGLRARRRRGRRGGGRAAAGLVDAAALRARLRRRPGPGDGAARRGRLPGPGQRARLRAARRSASCSSSRRSRRCPSRSAFLGWIHDRARGRAGARAGAKPRKEREGGRLVIVDAAAPRSCSSAAGTSRRTPSPGTRCRAARPSPGVAIGGRTPGRRGRGPRGRPRRPRRRSRCSLAVNGDSREVSPDDLGLSVDYAASVAEAGGERTWDPQRLWDYYTGGEDLDPVVEPRRGQARRRARRPRRGVRRGGQERRRSRSGPGKAVVKDPVLGAEIDREGVADRRRRRVARGPRRGGLGRRRPDARWRPTSTRTTSRRRWTTSPTRRCPGPVELVFGGSPVAAAAPRLRDRAQAQAGRRRARAGAQDQGDHPAGRRGHQHRGRAPVDATVALVDGKPKVVPAKPGVSYEPRRRDRRVPRPGHQARGRALDRRRGDRRGAGVHHQGRQGAQDQGAGLHVHHATTRRRRTATRTSAAPPS